MLGQQGHRYGRVNNALGDHESSEPLAERVIVSSRMPDGNLLGFPRFHRTYRDGFDRDQSDVASSTGASVLSDCQRVKLHNTCGQPTVLRRWGRCRIMGRLSAGWVIEGPVFDFPLSSLHDGTTNTGIPALNERLSIGPRKMEMIVRHSQSWEDPIETELTIRSLE
jgi:hypothetical protein